MVYNICNDCVLRLFNDKCYCLKGVGNPLYGKIIVVPNVDYDAYKNKGMTFSKYVEIINEALSPSTGGLNDYFIVPLIRCKLTDKCPLNNNIISRCIIHTIRDIVNTHAVKILLLGDAAKLFLSITDISNKTDKLYITKDNGNIRGYCVSYSPFVKYIDDNKYKEFCNHLIKWYNANKDNNYNGYEINII